MWRDGGRFDGWSEHFSYDRWMAAAERELTPLGVDVAWYTTREREESEVLAWDHIDSGLDKEWLWQDWLDALDETEVDDCRWTPCFDCGVCPQMGTEIEIGPTGKTLLPLTVLGAGRECDGRAHPRLTAGHTEPAAERLRRPRSPCGSSPLPPMPGSPVRCRPDGCSSGSTRPATPRPPGGAGPTPSRPTWGTSASPARSRSASSSR